MSNDEEVDIIGEFETSNSIIDILTLNSESSTCLIEEGYGREIIYGDELDCLGEVVTIEDESFDDTSTPFPNEQSSYDLPEEFKHVGSQGGSQNNAKFKQTLTVNRSLLKSNQHRLEAQTSTNATNGNHSSNQNNHSKFRQTLNFKPTNVVLNEHTMKIFRNKIKAIHKRKAQAEAREKKKKPRKKINIATPKPVKKQEAINYISQKSKPIVDPRNSGEIVRVEKAESDIEVDILSNSEDDLILTEPLEIDSSRSTEEMSVDNLEGNWISDGKTLKRLQELKEADEGTYGLLEDLEVPNSEIVLETSNISNLEKFFHSEFFMQRTTKTPERYLKIRNHIINMWITQAKPNYLSKTTARSGLKNCGDVNCISRIFSMLEQIGAINYNCPEVSWIRPLKVLYTLFEEHCSSKQNFRNGSVIEKKQRIRNPPIGSGSHDTNITISHDGTTFVSSEGSDSMVKRIKSRTMHRANFRTEFELIGTHCFSKDNVAPFQVSITLSCLICMYLHALSSRLEIMGFLGGKCVEDKLTLTRYKPCKTSNQTAINCEMCPVSQVEQSCNLVEEGYELLGWFHSHPNFPPIPSRTDLRTQAEMQLQFASNNPFIGFIISCVDMKFKCIYMQNETAFELEVDIIKDYGDVRKDIQDVVSVIERDDNYEEIIQKFICSGNNLLRELSLKETIDSIVQECL